MDPLNDNNSSHEDTNEEQITANEDEDAAIDSNEENSDSMRAFDSDSGSVQYQFKTENGQGGSVTYRVVTVDDSHPTHTVVTPTIVSPNQHSSVALLTAHSGNPFGAATQQLAAASGTDGPFYVMMAPTQEIISHSTTNIRRTRSATEGGGTTRVARDEKRRATHNEVERRRRDKINNWIIKLSKVVPDCQQDHTKQGQSKGGILAKATEYIQDLCAENARLNEVLKENEILSNELDAIRQQFVDTKNENRRLKALLQKYSIPIDDNN
ncbi:upstream stimulatory factor 1-like isoform X2 [Oppia nitens]|uniref:upstream stimulatory factor 1-like isoform X2 n=1 Tax=Oppia nitens TaxID=1686743 RepID=UPI0023DA80B4|nr:upstream stimulatory factor 1-like isoform X2 [Oppia nitens]